MESIYICECEKCGNETKVKVNKNESKLIRLGGGYITAYGYLTVKCRCGGSAYAAWMGFDKDETFGSHI